MPDPVRLQRTLARRLGGFVGRLQLLLDLAPRRALYHPIPWLGVAGARRSEGSAQRLQAVVDSLTSRQCSTVVDVGANTGYFSVHLAQAAGLQVLAVEGNPRFARVLRAARDRAGVADRVGILETFVTGTTVQLLPQADAFLVLSIWHHWNRHLGEEGASELLAALWARTGRVLYFDAGEEETAEAYRLPVRHGLSDWYADYLGRTLPGAMVVALGRFPAFGPGGSEDSATVERTLFAVERRPG